ncbi:nicotinate-nucleotide adenylyltransferase [Methylosarcina fibrata]|uniref:nicotinate-nucleotide adenylyltransferase n=1 Tax=Methylosarcina fibrata TaxID=105972 RepID=UPI000376E7EB|nr:nicotinate-nucleotide adenylyltransferase [Methylosarcina fibrata]
MIGIFGGTFDPVHYGHLRSALEAKELFGLSEVRLIPCSVPPHRPQPVAAPFQRLQMLKLGINNRPGWVVDTRELDRAGPSYMVDTLRSLRNEFPGRPLLLFIGCDAFNGLTSWHRWQHLFEYAHLAVLTRPGFAPQPLNEFFKLRLAEEKEQLRQAPAGKLFFQPITLLDVSATRIRQAIAEKRNPDFLLPDAVLDYIRSQGLYEK